MVTRRDVIKNLKKLGGITTEEGKYYKFEISQFDKEPKDGANGFILKAFDEENKEVKEVAVKFYFPRNPSDDYKIEKDDYKRFKNEISILKKAECQNLIQCFGKGEVPIDTKSVPFYVMPYAKGCMRDLLKEGKFKDINFTYRFFRKLGSAIQWLHKQEVNGEKCYHRDLKPENVLFMEDKEDEPLLADLGLAHINPRFAAFEVDSARMLRNPYYCAPEQISGDAKDVDHRADIYAFGYMSREAFTGEHPRGENAPLPSEKIGAEYITVDAVVLKCIEYEKHERYQSIDECLNELKIAFEGALEEKAQLAAFYIARQRIKSLARYCILTSELLSAGNLKALYLNQSRFKPSEREKDVIFYNLLMRGKGKTHTQRTQRPDSPTAMNSPGPLGWVWFADLEKDKALKLIRQALSHEDIFVCAGAIKTLGLFGGTEKDIVELRKKLRKKNPQIVSEAIVALVRVGTQDDIETIRNFKNDQRTKVLEAMLQALSISKYRKPEDEETIKSLLEHNNPNVKRTAGESLKRFIGLEPGENSFERKISHILSEEYHLDSTDSEENRNKARYLLRSNNLYYWHAGIRWFISQGLKNEIEKIIKNYGWNLRFAKLEDFDYYLYCPDWWRDVMD